MYFIVVPRSLWRINDEFGVWDVVKTDDNDYLSFSSVEQAKEYADKAELPPTYLVLELVG